jgi:hypothetical protein
MIVFHAAGDAPVSLRKLSIQFLSTLSASGILSYVLSLTVAAYWTRVTLAGLLGAFGVLAISAIYWNCTDFPTPSFLLREWTWSSVGHWPVRLSPS